MPHDEEEVYELVIEPESPDTVATVRDEIESLIDAALSETSKSHQLSEGEIDYEVEKPFPDALVIQVLITFASKVATDLFIKEVLPVVKKRFKVWWKKRQKT